MFVRTVLSWLVCTSAGCTTVDAYSTKQSLTRMYQQYDCVTPSSSFTCFNSSVCLPGASAQEREWRMAYSVDAPATGDLRVLVAGDNDGRVHVLVGGLVHVYCLAWLHTAIMHFKCSLRQQCRLSDLH